MTDRGGAQGRGIVGARPAARAQQSAVPATVPVGAGRLPMLAKVVVLAMLLPAYFSIGSLSMNPSKLLFLGIVPVLLVKLLRGNFGRLLPVDGLIFGYAAWMTLAMLANHTPRVAIEYTGSSTVTFLGGYLTTRATIRSKADFIALIRFLALVVILTLPFATYEVITSRTTIPRWLAEIPGFRSHGDINHDPRLGLWRAQVVFPHPIHYGIFCSLAFSLTFVGLTNVMGRFKRLLASGLIGLCCFFSVSSGPVLALAVQIGLISWSYFTRWMKSPWKVFWILLLVMYVVIEIGSNRPGIYAVVERLTFNSRTAFSRRVLFEHGVDQILRDPILGVGYNSWPLPPWMTGSVDNFWLFLAVRFGLPTFLFFFGAFVWAMIAVGWRDFRADPDLNLLRRAWIFTMTSTILVLATAAIWGEIYSMVLFMLGSGIWMLKTEVRVRADPTDDAPPQTPRQRAALPYTRFPTAPAQPRVRGPKRRE